MKRLTPNLMVEDVNASLEYYIQKLGFEFAMGVAENPEDAVPAYRPEQVLIWGMVRRGDAEIMFQRRDSLSEDVPELAGANIGASASLYMETDALDELHESAQAGLEIVKDLNTTFYGMREFYIRDLNGYILAFAQPITPA